MKQGNRRRAGAARHGVGVGAIRVALGLALALGLVACQNDHVTEEMTQESTDYGNISGGDTASPVPTVEMPDTQVQVDTTGND